ncbi:Glucomannan 4-beta-mannosyltransferase 2 [Vitis vinifera]|uniref:Glucomannan 4-beta-mannosyltransferase 2 n=1 Tax=Vitis vinifera TaxID=29760 RepID=A0A438F378_VITVI|nr:Glucomannan 4-beta-mannosyltransferase 2 [Vitis vinifera]
MAEISAKTLIPETFQGTRLDIAGQIGLVWELVKAPLIVPLLRVAVYICLTMSLMLFVERLYMGIVIILVKIFWKKPDKRYKWEPLREDLESGNSNFPHVVVQIPMYNEKEVYKLSIGAACGLSWPADRLVIQVLDDSTDPTIKCQSFNENVDYFMGHLTSQPGGDGMPEMGGQRHQHKVPNQREQSGVQSRSSERRPEAELRQALRVRGHFDADFQPEPDYLKRAIPFLVYNSDIALVQGRWRFVNADECLMTRMQEMSLDYHFTVEQEVGSATHAFFGFNGTAGVWRIAAINEAGGWKDRTTVEDMDLAVRASLKGWKFVYLGDLQVKSELPSTFKAFRFQQHRWSCGPANLFRKMVMEIVRNKKVRFWKKVYVIYSFFLVRKIVAHMVTFCLYCVVLPLTILIPEVEIPIWGIVYIPSIITTLNAVGTPRSTCPLSTILCDTLKNKANTKAAAKRPRFKIGDRINTMELGFSAFLFFCACYDFLYGKYYFYVYLFLQTITYFIVGNWVRGDHCP